MKNSLYILFIYLLTPSAFGQCLSSNEEYFSKEALSQYSGSANLDNIIKLEYQILSQTFQLNTDFYFGGDSYGSENAFFMPTNQCSSPGCVGIIAVGRNLLIDRLQKKHGIEIIKALMAHEYGHALQSKLGWSGGSKWKELHADFMAGFYMAQKTYITEDLLNSFIQEFYSIGDYGFYDPSHHGTPIERGCAFREGFYASRKFNLSLYSAYKSGVVYLQGNSPCNQLTQTHINADLNQVRGYDGVTDLSYYDPTLIVAAATVVAAAYLTYATINYFDEVSLSLQFGYLKDEQRNIGRLTTIDMFKNINNEDRILLTIGGSSNKILCSIAYLKGDLLREFPRLQLGGGLQYYGPSEKSNFPLFITGINDHYSKGRWTISERFYLSRDIFTIGASVNYNYKFKK